MSATTFGRTYTVYARKDVAEFDNNYGGVTESVTYDCDTNYDGQDVEAYTFVSKSDRRSEERLLELLKTDSAVVTFGLDPVQL